MIDPFREQVFIRQLLQGLFNASGIPVDLGFDDIFFPLVLQQDIHDAKAASALVIERALSLGDKLVQPGGELELSRDLKGPFCGMKRGCADAGHVFFKVQQYPFHVEGAVRQIIGAEWRINGFTHLPEKSRCEAFFVNGIGHNKALAMGLDQSMGEQKGVLFVTWYVLDTVKHHIYKSGLELPGLFSDVVKMGVLLVKKPWNGFFHIVFVDGFRGFRLDVDGEQGSQPVDQPRLSCGIVIHAFHGFLCKGLVGFSRVLGVKVPDVFQGKGRQVHLVGDVERGHTAHNEFGDVADAHKPYGIEGLVGPALVFLIQLPQSGEKIFQLGLGDTVKLIDDNQDLFLGHHLVQRLEQLTESNMVRDGMGIQRGLDGV